MASVTADFDATDETTDWLAVSQGPNAKFTVGVRGTYTGDITIEAKRLGSADATRYPFATIATDAEILTQYELAGAWEVRAYATALNSGTAVVTLYNDV